MKRIWKKVLPFFICMLMLAAILPQTAFAEEGTSHEISSFSIKEFTAPEYSCRSSHTISDETTGETVTYYEYHPEWENIPEVSITVDGISYSGDWETVSEELYDVIGENWLWGDGQSYEDRWSAGSTYDYTIRLYYYDEEDNETYVSCDTKVTLEPSPVSEFSVEDIQLVEHLNGTWDEGVNGSGETVTYFRYNLPYANQLVCHLKYNGVSYSGGIDDIADRIEKDTGVYPDLHSTLCYYYTQGPDNYWEVGNTYPIQIEVFGERADVNVVIIKNPLTSFKVSDVQIMEGTCGYYQYTQDGSERFFYYEPQQSKDFSCSIVYDGKTYSGTLGYIQNKLYELTGTYPYVSTTMEQSVEKPWMPNKTYPVTMELAGIKATFNVKITPSLLTSIKMDDIEILEETNGYQFESEPYYYEYVPLTKGSFVYNGKEYKGTYDELNTQLRELTGSYTYISFVPEQPQNADTPWLAGNSYKVTATALGKSCTFNVKINKAVTPTAMKPLGDTNLTFYNGYYYYNTFFGVKYEPANGKQGTTWEVEDPSIISVYGQEPLVNSFSFNGLGTTKVTATSTANPALKQTFNVTITEGDPPAGTFTTSMKAGKWGDSNVAPTDLTDSPQSIVMKVGEYYALQVTVSSPLCIPNLGLDMIKQQIKIADATIWDADQNFLDGKITRTMLFRLQGKEAGVETLKIGDYSLKIGVSDDAHPLFNDVMDKSAWYYDTVYQIASTKNKNGKPLMSGYSNGSNNFGPADPLTRQDFAVILYRLADEPAIDQMDNPFKDTDPNGYYYNCVLWAKAKNVIAGYNDGRFGVGDKITREQVATILYRFAKDYMHIDTSGALEAGDLSKFKDGTAVSSWAEEALTWATGAGVITGKSGGTEVAARGDAARAEIGAMVLRFIKYMNAQQPANQQ